MKCIVQMQANDALNDRNPFGGRAESRFDGELTALPQNSTRPIASSRIQGVDMTTDGWKRKWRERKEGRVKRYGEITNDNVLLVNYFNILVFHVPEIKEDSSPGQGLSGRWERTAEIRKIP